MSTILATGAFLKNRAGLLQGSRFTGSDEHGDLSTPEACVALEASVRGLVARAEGRIAAVAHDLHPDFHSTRLALQWAAELRVPAIAVQHHHAHIAVALAEHAAGEPVIGLALDGVGLGTDRAAWGGELLAVDGARFERVGHLLPLALPGGDRAAREPWRMAAAVLTQLGRTDAIETAFAPKVGAAKAKGVADLIARGVHCPITTAAGRWFDAAAGVLGLSTIQQEEAQAAIALERAASRALAAGADPSMPPLPIDRGVIDLRPLFARLVDCPADLIDQGALLFHHALADALVRGAAAAARERGIGCVALGGGCFFNGLLSQRIQAGLERQGLRVLRPQTQSVGDAGLALGQAWVAARVLETRPEAAPCA